MCELNKNYYLVKLNEKIEEFKNEVVKIEGADYDDFIFNYNPSDKTKYTPMSNFQILQDQVRRLNFIGNTTDFIIKLLTKVKDHSNRHQKELTVDSSQMRSLYEHIISSSL